MVYKNLRIKFGDFLIYTGPEGILDGFTPYTGYEVVGFYKGGVIVLNDRGQRSFLESCNLDCFKLHKSNYVSSEVRISINPDLYNKLEVLGILPNADRSYNIGESNYSEHVIQPWSIWKDYNLNPWDADIVKRVLRTKNESGKDGVESRIMDYEKIIHICKERIRQLKVES